MKKLTFLFAIIFALTTGCSERSTEADQSLLGAAGSGTTTEENTGGSTTGGTTTTTAATNTSTSVIVITDNSLIETGGTEIAKITALIKDKDNVLVADSDVKFSATGGALKVITSVTDVDGTATAQLGLDGDPMNQDIVVSATADGVTSSVNVKAAGTAITMAGPTALVAGDNADVIATLAAGNGEPISNTTIDLNSQNSNAIDPTSAITDENGQIRFSVGSTAGSDVISASALDGNVLGQYELNVAADLLTFISPAAGAELAVDQNHLIKVKWFSNGAPVVGQTLSFSVTSGLIVGASKVATDNDGIAAIQVTSVSAGVSTISVGGLGADDPATKLDIEYVATQASTLMMTAAPRVVSTGSDTVITATVLDGNANPVKGKVVKFETAQAFGGVMSPSAVTDSNGEASVTFTAGTLATQDGELVVVAKVADTESVTGSVALTVNKRELNVTIGTTDNLREQANDTQYSQPYVVQVADGSGQPVKSATVTVSYQPLSYGKGRWIPYDTSVPADDKADQWGRILNDDYILCQAEDVNSNGKLDAGEDTNGNGKLDPQNPSVLAADTSTPTLQSGSITTDENGFGYFSLVYPQSNASWSILSITASATAQNVEAESSYISYMPVLAEEIIDVTSNMPNTISPYGSQLDCTNAL